MSARLVTSLIDRVLFNYDKAAPVLIPLWTGWDQQREPSEE
ncbi:MAG TPA: hypothetical protein VNT03_00980 [Baekduia sp.]|nr:hypothetical protein [Baekduia sp.]